MKLSFASLMHTQMIEALVKWGCHTIPNTLLVQQERAICIAKKAVERTRK
jgi:hypothetical protein